MDTTSDKAGMFEAAVTLMVVRLLHYSEVMEKRGDRDALDRAESICKRSIMLGHRHDEDIEKLLDVSYARADASGISGKRRKYLGFILYDLKVRAGIITKGAV